VHECDGEPPGTVTYAGTEYWFEGPAFDSRELRDGLTVAAAVRPSLRDGYFESRQLGRFDPNHKGEFSPSGMPRFTSREQAREYAQRVRDQGIDCRYGEL
jgi:hypothetical protein